MKAMLKKLITELNEEAQELIDFGDSKEKAKAQGIMTAIEKFDAIVSDKISGWHADSDYRIKNQKRLKKEFNSKLKQIQNERKKTISCEGQRQ